MLGLCLDLELSHAAIIYKYVHKVHIPLVGK